MNAPLSKEQLARLAVGSLDYHGEYVEGLAAPIGGPAPEGIIARWMRVLGAWIAAYRERQAVISELSRLSDRELEDIGLNRANLDRVFDPEFTRERAVL